MHIIRRQQSQDLCSFLLISAPFLDQSSPHLYDRIIHVYTNPTLANSLMKLVPLEQCILYIVCTQNHRIRLLLESEHLIFSCAQIILPLVESNFAIHCKHVLFS